MKKYLISAIFALLFIITPLNVACMNNSNNHQYESIIVEKTGYNNYVITPKTTQITETSHLFNIKLATFIDNEKILIAGDKSYSFIDLRYPEKEIKVHPADYVSDIAVNKDGSSCALSEKEQIKIFCTKTEDKLYTIDHNQTIASRVPICFDSQNPSCLFYRFNSQLCYHNHKLPLFNWKKDIANEPFSNYLVCHPKQTELMEFGQKDISSKNYQCITCIPEKYYLPINHNLKDVVSAEYNKNGTKLVYNTKNEDLYIDELDHPYRSCTNFLVAIRVIQEKDNKHLSFPSIAFHPNGVIVASLTDKGVIEYYDCSRGIMVVDRSLRPIKSKPYKTTIHDNYPSKRLSFSPDGTLGIAAFNDLCAIFSVPFLARFTREEQKKIILFAALQDYTQKNDIPNDIIKLILDTYLELYKH
jgi:WD40 repeat protein